jgi:hypothetical protein
MVREDQEELTYFDNFRVDYMGGMGRRSLPQTRSLQQIGTDRCLR